MQSSNLLPVENFHLCDFQSFASILSGKSYLGLVHQVSINTPTRNVPLSTHGALNHSKIFTPYCSTSSFLYVEKL